MNPEPKALNATPLTLNPKPYTLNPQPQILTPTTRQPFEQAACNKATRPRAVPRLSWSKRARKRLREQQQPRFWDLGF